jgi:predicted SprT family Zn-dependent metalloprotease
VRLRIIGAISLVSLITICWGVRFAIAQERRREPEFLQSKYQALNREFFDNSLPKVRIEWADLTDYNYLGETYRENDGTFVVLVDRRTNLRDEVLQDTVFHEMCHVATWRQQDDPHGSAFRACMAGIQVKALQDGSMKAR